jgi:cell division protein ZapA
MAQQNNPPTPSSNPETNNRPTPAAKVEQNYVTVDIYDQAYHLSGPDSSHVERLAARVDSRMRAVASTGRTADSLRVAVLAALNLADELARAEDRLRGLEGTLDVAESANLHIRAASLSGLLDTVLEEDRKTGS